MLFNTRIVTSSGMLMFEKIWEKVSENMDTFQTMTSGLLTAMMKTAQSAVQMSMRYISVGETAIAIAQHAATGITCYVFYEEKDGEDVGHYVCESVLREFISQYQLDEEQSSLMKEFKQLQDMSLFQSFNVSIVTAIRKALKTMLQDYKKTNGILAADVIEHERSTSADSDTQSSGFEVIANTKTMVLLIDSMMSLKAMGTSQLNIIDYTTNRLVLKKVRTGCLVIVAQKTVTQDDLRDQVIRVSSMVETIQTILASLQSSMR